MKTWFRTVFDYQGIEVRKSETCVVTIAKLTLEMDSMLNQG